MSSEPGSPRSAPVRDIAYGSFAGAAAKLFEHPFDLIKVRLQSQSPNEPLRFKGPLDCFKQTFTKEGVRGLYRGVSMPIAGAMAENATLFFVYNRVKSIIRAFDPPSQTSPSDSMSLPKLAIAAGCAGGAVSFVLTPIELIKCRMQVQQISLAATSSSHASSSSSLHPKTPHSSSATPKPLASTGQTAGAHTLTSSRKLPGPIAIVRDILRTDGTRGLWLGQTGTLLRETGGGIAWFLAFEALSDYFLKRLRKKRTADDKTIDPQTIIHSDLPAWQLMLGGVAAGVSYNVVLYPADSIKSTIQTEKELGYYSGRQRGFLEVGRDIYRGRGLAGLYSGCGLTCLRSGPGSALIFVLFSLCERYLG